MILETLSIVSLVLGVIFLVLVILLLTKPKDKKINSKRVRSDLKEIKDQINGFEEAW